MTTPEDNPIEQLVNAVSDFSYANKELRTDPHPSDDAHRYLHSFDLSAARAGELLLPDMITVPLDDVELQEGHHLGLERWHDTPNSSDPGLVALRFSRDFRSGNIKGTLLTDYEVPPGDPKSLIVSSTIEALPYNKDQEARDRVTQQLLLEARVHRLINGPSESKRLPLDREALRAAIEQRFSSIDPQESSSMGVSPEINLEILLSDCEKQKLVPRKVSARRIVGFTALIKSLQVSDVSDSSFFRF